MAASRRSSLAPNRGVTSVNVESDFSLGMKRDAPRSALPPGSVWNSTDFLLDQPGVARKRGGTAFASPALSGATYVAAVVYAEFPAGNQLVAVSQSGHNKVYKIDSAS